MDESIEGNAANEVSVDNTPENSEEVGDSDSDSIDGVNEEDIVTSEPTLPPRDRLRMYL